MSSIIAMTKHCAYASYDPISKFNYFSRRWPSRFPYIWLTHLSSL